MSGKEVKNILKNSGINLAHLAKQMKISPQYLQNILRSKNLSSGRIEEIQKLTGIKFWNQDDIRKKISEPYVSEQEIKYNKCTECEEKDLYIKHLLQESISKSNKIREIELKLKRTQDELSECLKELPNRKQA